MIKKLCKLSLFTVLLSLTLISCSGGSGGNNGNGGNTGPTYGYYTSPSASAQQFVNSLNNVDGTNGSYVELYEDETYRSQVPGQEDWFVIYDAYYGEYKAVSLQYIRTIQYYDYVRNTNSLAAEFRAIESNDIYNGYINGDYYGDDYEVVDYQEDAYGNYWFVGRNSGYEYEDEAETTDVILLAAEKEQKKFYTRAAAVSVEYNVGIETAMGLVTLGTKVGAMTKKGDLSLSDISLLSKDVESLTGATMSDIISAGSNKELRVKLLKDVAKKVGTTESNIEQKLLPELFGIEL